MKLGIHEKIFDTILICICCICISTVRFEINVVFDSYLSIHRRNREYRLNTDETNGFRFMDSSKCSFYQQNILHLQGVRMQRVRLSWK